MAASAGSIRAGAAYVELGLKDSAFVKGLNASAARLKALGASIGQIGSSIKGMGTSITDPFMGAAKSYAETGAALTVMSERTGFSVEMLSALSYAALQTGADMSDVETGIRKMQKSLEAGSEENLKAEATFVALGLSVQKLMKLSPADQFYIISKAISAVPNLTRRASDSMNIFGRSGTTLLPMGANLEELMVDAHKLGTVMSTEAAKGAEKLHLAMATLDKVISGVKNAIGSALAPELTGLFEVFMNVAIGVRDFVKENKQLVLLLFGVGAALVAFGAAVVGAGTFLFFAGVILSQAGIILGGIGTILGMLLSPIGLVVAFLTVLGYHFLTTSQIGKQALAWLGQTFGQLLADAKAAFQGISDALEAGDIMLAAQILWASLRVEWLKGTNFLAAVWRDWSSAVSGTFESIWINARAILRSAMAMIKAVISGDWLGLCFVMINAWEHMLAKIVELTSPYVMAIQNLIEGSLDKFAANMIEIAIKKSVTGGGAADEFKKKEEAGNTAPPLQGRLDAIERQRQRQQTELAARQKAVADAAAAGDEKELADAQAELAKLLAESKNQANLKRLSTKKGAGESGDPFTPDALDNAMGATKRKIDVSGTFSGAALAGLGAGSSVQDDQLKEQKKIGRGIEKLNDTVKKKQGGVFAGAP